MKDLGLVVPKRLREILIENNLTAFNLQASFARFWERLAELLVEEGAVNEDTVILAGQRAWDDMAEAHFAPPSKKALAAIAHDKSRGKESGFVSISILAKECGVELIQLRAWHRRGQIDLAYRGGPYAAATLTKTKLENMERSETTDEDDDDWSGPEDA